jgi:alkyl hydroperoxide reductase subunit F
MIYDLAILGGGPAGVSAGVYAARKQLKTAFITKDFGGQSIVSDEIQNWIGTIKISGADLSKSLENHLKYYSGDFVSIFEDHYINLLSRQDDYFVIKTDKSEFLAKTVLITTGSHRRKLDVKGADVFENKGITYCASCDGPVFSGQDVVVIGGGNAAFESSAQLLAYTKSVTLLNRSDKFKADEVTVEKLRQNPKMNIITNAKLLEVFGDKFVSGIKYLNSSSEIVTLNVSGIFVEIGALPTTEFAKDVVKLNDYGYVVVDPKNQRTETLGIWSAGDCTNGLYHQNNIASGDAIKALEDIYIHLHTK